MADIVISEFMDEASVATLGTDFDVLYDPALVDDPERLIGEAGAARALIVRNRTQVRGDLLTAAAKLSVVGRLGVGLDNIDLAACKARGIAVHPATGANDLSVAEYVMTATLMLLRTAWLSTNRMIAGEWPRQTLIGREASGKTMGLIGLGAIARQVAARAEALGMTVVAHDPYLPRDHEAWAAVARRELADLLGEADVISLHTPLTDATRHLIDATALARVKPTAIVINAARGGVVDDAALAEALRGGKLGGAALDVFEVEPLTGEAGAVFAGAPNLVLTPHIAGVSEESNVRVGELIARKIATHLRATS